MTQIDTHVATLSEPLTSVIRGQTSPGETKTRDPLAYPEAVDRKAIDWAVVGMFGLVHLFALAAFVPWLFSWSSVAACVLGTYLIGAWGINICYHRLLTHRSFATPRWFEHVLSCLAFCNMEGSSIRWIATHRMHHQHSDHQPDPHSPLVNFLWSHVGWMIIRNRDIDDDEVLSRYARDLTKDPFHVWMHKSNKWLLVWLAHVVLIFGAGFGLGYYQTGSTSEALRLGLSFIVWGVLVRTVMIWHVTWAINSITHVWGYRNYKTTDDSRNNWLLGLLAFGEGWHNNHHADQRSAAAGHKWWEFDLSYQTIRVFRLLGLARDIVTPARNHGTSHDIGKKLLKTQQD